MDDLEALNFDDELGSPEPKKRRLEYCTRRHTKCEFDRNLDYLGKNGSYELSAETVCPNCVARELVRVLTAKNSRIKILETMLNQTQKDLDDQKKKNTRLSKLNIATLKQLSEQYR